MERATRRNSSEQISVEKPDGKPTKTAEKTKASRTKSAHIEKKYAKQNTAKKLVTRKSEKRNPVGGEPRRQYKLDRRRVDRDETYQTPAMPRETARLRNSNFEIRPTELKKKTTFQLKIEGLKKQLANTGESEKVKPRLAGNTLVIEKKKKTIFAKNESSHQLNEEKALLIKNLAGAVMNAVSEVLVDTNENTEDTAGFAAGVKETATETFSKTLFNDKQDGRPLTAGLVRKCLDEAIEIVQSSVDRYAKQKGEAKWAQDKATTLLSILSKDPNKKQKQRLVTILSSYPPQRLKDVRSKLAAKVTTNKDSSSSSSGKPDITPLRQLRDLFANYGEGATRMDALRALDDDLFTPANLKEKGSKFFQDNQGIFTQMDGAGVAIGDAKSFIHSLAMLPDPAAFQALLEATPDDVSTDVKLRRLNSIKTWCEEAVPDGEAKKKTLKLIDSRIGQVRAAVLRS